jgi:uncharacterized protein (TIGR02452 family)
VSQIDRNVAAAEETVRICEEGIYETPNGQICLISEDIRASILGTLSHPPEEAVPLPRKGSFKTRVNVLNEDTLEECRRQVGLGASPLALNFASAKNPGGGFLHGAEAQEESLCRRCGLYPCLVDQPMYPYHRNLRGSLYTSWMIYSPKVPVFRGADGELLEKLWFCSFLTAPAPNVGALKSERERKLVPGILRERVRKILSLSALHGHTHLVLGAWGCGVFGGDPGFLSNLFRFELVGDFAGCFQEVTFAVLDPGKTTIEAFHKVFPHETL